MALVKRSESNLPTFFDRLNELADWSTNNFTSSNASMPAVNVRETDDDYLIEVAAPGMKIEDFKTSEKPAVPKERDPMAFVVPWQLSDKHKEIL